MAPIAARVITQMRPEIERLTLASLCRRLDCTKLRAPPADNKS
jgi:hypothetical protein